MKKLILIILLINTYSVAFPQHIIKDLELEIPGYNAGIKNLLKLTESIKYDDIQGSPYLRKEFLSGQIQINDTSRYNNLLLRYNIYDNQIEFKTKNDLVMELINPCQYQLIIIGDQTFKCLTYQISNIEQTGILEILAIGRVKLYKKYEVDFSPATAPAPFKDPEPDKFIGKDPFYLISIENETPFKLKNTRAVLSTFEKVKPEISAYVRDHKINIKSEEGLIQLTQYCNK